jgi:hypothetical protein
MDDYDKKFRILPFFGFTPFSFAHDETDFFHQLSPNLVFIILNSRTMYSQTINIFLARESLKELANLEVLTHSEYLKELFLSHLEYNYISFHIINRTVLFTCLQIKYAAPSSCMSFQPAILLQLLKIIRINSLYP